MAHIRGTNIDAAKAAWLREHEETAHWRIQERADHATWLAQRQGTGWTTPLLSIN